MVHFLGVIIATRVYPEIEEWNAGVVDKLAEVKTFILNHRNTRQIRVMGDRRLSATLAIGAVFSATSGFTVVMEHRGIWWHTDDYAGIEDVVSLDVEIPQVYGEHLVVCIGIPNDIRQSVENYAYTQEASNYPLLNLVYRYPVENARQANSIVGQTKRIVLQVLSSIQAKHIHLFCAVPSFIALLLGHRLNATANVQCYEYIGPDSYVPTCMLKS